MADLRAWLKRHLSPNTVDTLRSVRHVSAQAIAGADLYQVRVDLERRIEERLRETEGVQDARIMGAVRDELASELDRWGQDMMDRMDILLGTSNRLVASLEERVAELEGRLAAAREKAPNGQPAAQTRGSAVR